MKGCYTGDATATLFSNTALACQGQFYKLSKANHPDLHPNDSHAAERFVKISEAHATLGSPQKKTRYDRDFLRASPSSTAGPSGGPSGSYSSAHAGSRPASGLSRRRTQFRGPPPSFYRSGGWGDQGEKRGEAASQAGHAHEAQSQQQQQQSQAGPAGTGPGGFTSGFDNDVRHFDHDGHYKTHSGIERTRHKARRKNRVYAEDLEGAVGGSSALFNFVMISGVLCIIFGVSGGLMSFSSAGKEKGKKEER
ncbi:hypothetical protein LTR78_009578 [Recurvomyces mirabilis]|uniref:J domain-containing protein n=1 Tax=Recurvomyces mirabilis TaxID=574656 RepID=A0AAE0TP80_9PEZI|nr:hypothetical protein LTR78_009578 [Recurvomyces mirabilis]KAK5156577.1 hypothetical protein LTS14_004789 [Recurvomyces mirabilis]